MSRSAFVGDALTQQKLQQKLGGEWERLQTTLRLFSAAGTHLEPLVGEDGVKHSRQLEKNGYPVLSKLIRVIPICAVAARDNIQTLESIRSPELLPLERRLECPSLCGQQVIDHQLDYHLTTLCKKRVTPCELGCGKTIRYDLMGRHVAFKCVHRGIVCKYCDEVVLQSQLEWHQKNQCTGQPATCELCAENMTLQQLPLHIKKFCKARDVECNWCGVITAYESRRTHKFSHCPKRWEKAKELCRLLYMGGDLFEVADMINDGAHPTLGPDNGRDEAE